MGRPQVTVHKIHAYTGHLDSVFALARGREAYTFFSSGGDGQVAQWNLQTPNEGQLLAKLPTSVYALHYWARQNTLIVGQNTEGIHLVDLATRQERGSLKLTDAAIFDIKTIGTRAWVACGDGMVHVVDLETLQVVERLEYSQQSARCLAVHPEQELVAIGYSDNHVRWVDASTLTLQQETLAHNNSVFGVLYDPRGRYLLSCSRDARYKVWTPEAGRYVQKEEVIAHMYAINHMAFRHDGRYFATASMDKAIKIWDADSFQLLKVIDKARHAGHGTSVNKVWWSPFENQLVSGSDDRTLSVWDVTIEASQL